ncbi:MAG: hypothetical protein ABMB14_35565 [Myxococcota bacterium]
MWTLTLAVAAVAGPLDLPDPGDMGRYRCVERAATLAGDPPLTDRVAIADPPGPPTFGPGVEPALAPYATDDAIAKAAKKKLVALPAVGSLAVGGRPVVMDCENTATDRNDFSVGCRLSHACELLLTVEGTPVALASKPQVASKFAPVESVTEAVGLLAFYERDLFLPLTPGEREAWLEEAAGYQAVNPPVPWIEVEPHPGGWLIRAPRKGFCGCDHDLVRRAYWVSTDGRSCAVDEKPVTLAQDRTPVCVD